MLPRANYRRGAEPILVTPQSILIAWCVVSSSDTPWKSDFRGAIVLDNGREAWLDYRFRSEGRSGRMRDGVGVFVSRGGEERRGWLCGFRIAPSTGMLPEILVERQRALETSHAAETCSHKFQKKKRAPSRSEIRVGVEKSEGGLVLSFFTLAKRRRILSGATENARKGVRRGRSLSVSGVVFMRLK